MISIRLVTLLSALVLFLGGVAANWTTISPAENVVFATLTPPSLAASTHTQPLVAVESAVQPNNSQVAAIIATDRDLADTAPPSLGQVMVLMYHQFGPDNTELQRPPASFRSDLERLHQQGFIPVNLIDLTEGLPNLKPGQKPVVLTFDDSHVSQFRLLEDGTIDPESAIGILQQFHLEHPETWPLKGTFFVLLDNGIDSTLFGQADIAHEKLNWLVEQGFEVGSHTVTHLDLGVSNGYQVVEELARSQRELEMILSDYDVRSFAVPYGSMPLNKDYLSAGYFDGKWYTYANTVMAWGGPAASPHNPKFDPYRIPRIVVTDAELTRWLTYFENNPDKYYGFSQVETSLANGKQNIASRSR